MANSMEVVTIRMTRNYLRIGFKSDMIGLATSLNNANIIGDSVCDTVRGRTRDEAEKAEEMVNAVLNSVKLDAEYYHTMMEILRQNREYNALVRKLNEEFKKHGGSRVHEPVHPDKTAIRTTSTKISVWKQRIKLMGPLHLIRYYDSETLKYEKVQIIQDVAFNWEEVAAQLGFKESVIMNTKNPGSGKPREDCFKEILTKWMNNAEGMPNKDDYPANWRGIHNLLKDTMHFRVANELNDAIEAEYTDLKRNFNQAPPEDTEISHQDSGATPVASATPTTAPGGLSAAPPVQPQATSQTPANPPQAGSSRSKKMDKHKLAEWLLESGMDQEDVDFLKGKGVSELIFQRIKPGDKYSAGLSEGGLDLIPILQDELK